MPLPVATAFLFQLLLRALKPKARMTDEALDRLWTLRRERINRILEAPQKYKECEQCRSISFKHAGRCPICRCYRFIEDPLAVAATALEMRERPFPLSAAVAPRIFQNSPCPTIPTRPSAKRVDLYE